jgi:N-acetyl-anhydromuramyl-L-alanine amidase AmpD
MKTLSLGLMLSAMLPASALAGDPTTPPAVTGRPEGAAQSQPPGANPFDTSLLDRLDERHDSGGRELSEITHIVLHEGGAAASIVAHWQRDCERGDGCVGSHFAIAPDGTIHHLASLRRKMNHAAGMNGHTIGIELNSGISSGERGADCASEARTAGRTREQMLERCMPRYPEPLMRSLGFLLDFLTDPRVGTRFEITGERMLAHCMASSHRDPRGFDWTALAGYVGLSPELLPNEPQGTRTVVEGRENNCQFADVYRDFLTCTYEGRRGCRRRGGRARRA